MNDRDVQTFGSQGQQRTTAFSVKLAEIELIHSEIGEYPILLLDDVLSELDDYRQSHLLNTIQGKVQTFVTTTSVEGIDHQTLKEASTFHVKDGNIEKDLSEVKGCIFILEKNILLKQRILVAIFDKESCTFFTNLWMNFFSQYKRKLSLI